jgi:hypothetical protein
MALAATGSPDIVKNVSAAAAKELKLVGINWAYSPVADVNSDPRNPVIGKYVLLHFRINKANLPSGVRSFGDGDLRSSVSGKAA